MHAQTSVSDSTATPTTPTEEKIKLGARLALGGDFAFAMDGSENHPIYGTRARLLFPVGANCDVTTGGELLVMPGWSYSTYASNVYDALSGTRSDVVWKTTVPASQFAGVHAGLRFYKRTRKTGELLGGLSSRLQRLFWRKRVDRTGFHIGFGTGLVLGWHKRITRSVPKNGPLNVVVTESEMEHHEKTYARSYWTAPSFEVGWTFKGRIDLTLNYTLVSRFHQMYSGWEEDEASNAFAKLMVSGSLSYILGRTDIKEP